jgi:cell division protein FtsZ
MLMPENTPLVKPVNEFINPVKANAPAEPYMKQPKEEPKQTGLFDLFAAPKAEEPAVIKHDLMAEEPVANESEVADIPEMTFKLSEPAISYDLPVREQRAPEPVKEPEITVGADDNKTDESIEEQLRKSRERIMRLKDLSMKLRNGNIQELESVPAYKRKEIALQQTPASNESQISRFSLLPDDEGNTGIRNNNSFLHDNVD